VNFSFLSDPKYDFIGAFWMTIQLTFLSAIGAFIFGVILAAMRVSPVPLMRGFGTVVVNTFRNIPLTLIIIMMSQVIAGQLGLRLAVRQPGVNPQAFLDSQNFRLAVLGFIIYTSTFVCESIRAGINTVPPGQAEAARAIGLTFSQVLGIVVLPQAIRAVIAPVGSALIALTKNTTIAAAIGVTEASTLMAVGIEFDPDKITAIFLVVAAGFIALTLPVGLGFGALAKRNAVRR